jgi:hypothetical protein
MTTTNSLRVSVLEQAAAEKTERIGERQTGAGLKMPMHIGSNEAGKAERGPSWASPGR